MLAKIPRAMALAAPLVASVWLIVAAWMKFIDLTAFRTSLTAHGALGSSAIPVLAMLVPSSELAVGIVATWLLVIGRASRSCIVVSVPFLIFFVYALWIHGHPPLKPAACGCGWSRKPVENWLLVAAINAGVGCSLLATACLARSPSPPARFSSLGGSPSRVASESA